ncbi:hypothetical protein [Nocardioides daejeonensis]|uniref:hypothetical protein n=1 Tax=Nocardioides daejeonensis TaxID=1046556 RepID=UPI0013A5AA35|nr:hypothetical protein [Nocardioides daejeonensis]
MAQRLVLHIGAMKTGTSFLQSVFNAHVEALEEDGVRFLGGRFGAQSRAVRDVLDLPRRPKRNRRKWGALVKELRQHPEQTGVVSMEFLSFAAPRHLEALFEPLQGIEVEVVLTVRDLHRVVPAQWQTYTRNFGTDSWSDYQAHIRAKRRWRPLTQNRARHTFERAQNFERILGRWSSVVPADRITLVTVPGPDAPRDLLWRRFVAAAGLPETRVSFEETRDNASVGYGSCEVLRLLNEHLDDVRPRAYRSVMRPLINEVLAPLRAQESKPQLDRRTAEFASARNAQLHSLITERGHRFVGELAELPVEADAGALPRVSPPPAEAEIERALRALGDHLAPETGASPLPQERTAAVAEVAGRLRRAHGWG